MHIDELHKAYQVKTDEELLQLAISPEQLTTEAHAVLTDELARRRINVATQANVQDETRRGGIEQRRTPTATSGPHSHAVGEFLAEVLRTYHGDFWFFLKLMSPAVVLGFVAVMMGRNEGREIARHLPRGVEILEHKAEIYEIWFANSMGYFASWMAFCISFGAVCSVVSQIEAGIAVSIANSLAAVRERMGAFIRLSLLLLFLLLVGAGAIELLYWAGVFWVSKQLHVHPSSFALQFVPFGLMFGFLLLLSRFGLAMPAVILDNFRVGQAMFRSDELTEGEWLTLAGLLAKCVIGGYVAGRCPFWLASWIPANIPLPSWFPWVLTVASVAAVTVVEPTMFIGFALLYLRKSVHSSTSSEALVRQLA
jgi:hypothetical protein